MSKSKGGMRLSKALSNEFAGLRTHVAKTYAGLVQEVGGTAQASKILKDAGVGVGQREVQRQVAKDRASRGEPGHRGKAPGEEKRGYSERQYKALHDAAKAKADAEEAGNFAEAADAAKAKGLHVSVTGWAIICGSSREYRSIDTTITDPAALDAIFDAMAGNRYADAAEAFNAALFAAYDEGSGAMDGSEFESVDEFELLS